MKVVRATTLDEALTALASAGPDARLLAGGTDLLVEMESGRTRPDLVVDVWNVAELRGIRAQDDGLEIGALTTCTDLVRSPLAARHADLLLAAAREVGAAQIQNRATLGGNLGTASPAADLLPCLFAHGARVRLRSRSGAREVAVEDFVTGYRTNVRACDELVASVLVPFAPASERRAFRKVGTRRAQSISKAVIAVSVDLDGPRVRSSRLAAGSVRERTIRLAHAENALLGRDLDGASISAAARAAARQDARPRDDVRSSAAYRAHVVETLVARLLTGLAEGSNPCT